MIKRSLSLNNDTEDLIAGILAGRRRALARAITLVESMHTDHRRDTEVLLAGIAAYAGGAIRIGLSGAPGVGKSTFIDSLGRYAIAQGHRIAVLAVDPSSVRSGGSILGDKTRMVELARTEKAFIRPSPAGAANLGGVAGSTHESILLCEAAGFDTVMVETVGAGQSEIAVANMIDTFVLLLSPIGGDELQGVKRGIVESADLIVINKADGELADAAAATAAQYASALQLLRPRHSAWQVPVLLASALDGHGIGQVWDRINAHHEHLQTSGLLSEQHSEQAVALMWSELGRRLRVHIQTNECLAEIICALEKQVASGKLPPTVAASRLLDQTYSTLKINPSDNQTQPRSDCST